ncbi:hypothetical protein L336_0484 [Candidatus Saccharimonas aalborgensis]|uniref:Uncharacterized protein n=1 Tax=Candidatus Saccharimonas aalborgensis TaxID=1332188 RepID=R4PVE2_9BACT|nr:hypothetical protein L336_0484 [Candidatus Saccharimonas aalborgensis]
MNTPPQEDGDQSQDSNHGPAYQGTKPKADRYLLAGTIVHIRQEAFLILMEDINN